MSLQQKHEKVLMRKGQLKPGYNVVMAVDAEYIVGIMVSAERNDVHTFIPMMEKIKNLVYTNPTADSGFENAENYTWCEVNGQLAYIKPAKERSQEKEVSNRYRQTREYALP